MGYAAGCLLCCQSLHSPLIPDTGPSGGSPELTQVFDVFCEYMKLDPDGSIQEEYRGKLFPFCIPCSFKVYKLVECHQEKMRILEKLSQMTASMATLLLESYSEDHKSIAAEAGSLTDQIATIRNKVIEKYSPRVALSTIQPTKLSILRKTQCEETNDFGDDSMDVDYDVAGDDYKVEPDSSENEDRDSSFDGGRGRKTLKALSKNKRKLLLSLEKRKQRPQEFHTQTGENTFSIADRIYNFENGVFKCSDCSVTEVLQTKINRHILSAHVNSIPPIPEKSLEDFQVEPNKYLLANKFFFEGDKDSGFRCCRCEYTSILWSSMYNHIFKLHYGHCLAKPRTTRRFAPARPKGETVQLGETEYLYLGVRFWVLPHGSLRCDICGTLRSNLPQIRAHIRNHVDFMPELPDKDLEHYEIASNLFCLTRKYIFERTGDSFTCAFGECYEVRSCWEEMYAHIRSDHWAAELAPKPIKKRMNDYQLEDAESLSQESSLAAEAQERTKGQPSQDSSTKQNISQLDLNSLADLETSPGHYAYKGFEFHLSDQELYCGSCTYVCGSKRSLITHINLKHLLDCEGFVEVRPNEFLYLDEYPVTKEPDGRFRCGVDGCEFVTSFSLLGHVKVHIFQSHCSVLPNGSKVCQDYGPASQKQLERLERELLRYETGPGQYSYRGFSFHVVEDQFQCDSCSYRCTRKRRYIFIHISGRHVESRLKRPRPKDQLKFVELRPGEFLIDGEFPAFIRPDGKYKCGVGDCESVLSHRSGLSCHIKLRHKEEHVGLVCDVCGKVLQNQTTMRIHMAYVHAEVEEQKCPTCHKSFFTDFAFKAHLRVAHKEKKFQCDQCGKSYATSANLKEHMTRSHSDIKLTCSECDRVYSSRASLGLHFKADHAPGRVLYPCPVCQQEFKYKSSIKKHILVAHEGHKSSEVFKKRKYIRKSHRPQEPSTC